MRNNPLLGLMAAIAAAAPQQQTEYVLSAPTSWDRSSVMFPSQLSSHERPRRFGRPLTKKQKQVAAIKGRKKKRK